MRQIKEQKQKFEIEKQEKLINEEDRNKKFVKKHVKKINEREWGVKKHSKITKKVIKNKKTSRKELETQRITNRK